MFPENINEFLNKTHSTGLRDWIAANRSWIAASIKRKEEGDLGNYPIIPWIATYNQNSTETIKRVLDLRRRRILKEAEQKRNKRKFNRLKLNKIMTKNKINKYFPQKKQNNRYKYRKTDYQINKQLENEPRQKERRRQSTTNKQTTLNFP